MFDGLPTTTNRARMNKTIALVVVALLFVQASSALVLNSDAIAREKLVRAATVAQACQNMCTSRDQWKASFSRCQERAILCERANRDVQKAKKNKNLSVLWDSARSSSSADAAWSLWSDGRSN